MHATGAEVPARAFGEAVEGGGDRGEVLGVLAAQVVRGADGESVVGEHHGVPHFAHPLYQVVQQPVELA
ncbi:hypothetical protein SGLAM104S_07696 [Streptomyces glaucescens]